MKKNKIHSEQINMEKVKKIKEAIKNGSFEINSGKIADKFINEIGIDYLLKTKKEMH